jgi:hypothetical protein
VVDLAKTQEAWHRQQVDLYQRIVDRFGDRPELSRRVATAGLGVAYAGACADFWAGIAADPRRSPPPPELAASERAGRRQSQGRHVASGEGAPWTRQPRR